MKELLRRIYEQAVYTDSGMQKIQQRAEKRIRDRWENIPEGSDREEYYQLLLIILVVETELIKEEEDAVEREIFFLGVRVGIQLAIGDVEDV